MNRGGKRLLVISHGNTLRGLVMHLERLSTEVMQQVEIVSGVLLVVRLAPDLSLAGLNGWRHRLLRQPVGPIYNRVWVGCS